MSLVGILGSVLFGLVSDRLGGGRALALITFDAGLLWLAFLLGLPFPAIAVIIGLIGMHGSGAIPALSRAIADTLGAASFSRAYGLASTLTLPLMILGVVGTGTVYRINGNYALTVAVMVTYFAASVLLALWAARTRAAPATVSPG
jgi:hypothetical protein